ncbi:histone-like nucleoid-structuring protein Lsr2 [Microbacterium sp. NPDC058021]|uniref:Lsr2 family DNA-binding protein n=1 Tax=Microbacterium sp. NPDC058021 TaxID=3346306 RepID=UPI0036D7C9BA
MSAADRLEDSFPHGTADGYDAGCRGVICPAAVEHGLSCQRAKQLTAGDYQYQKLVRRGASPAEIAEALGLHPAPTGTHPDRRPKKPAKKPDLPVEVDHKPQEAPMPEPTPTPTPADVAAKVKRNRKPQTGPSQSVVRAWARENGLDVNPRGQVRADVVRAYLAAHAPILSKGKDAPSPTWRKLRTAVLAAITVDADEVPVEDLGMRREFTSPPEQAPVTLAEFADVPCENLTQGSCADEGSGRSPVSPYGATGYCWPCRIRHALRFDEVLVEGSWFKRAELPTILGNYMRTAEDFARQVKDITIAGAELAPAPEADAAAYAALELVLRKWAGEKDRADALQRALDDERERLGAFARMLTSYQVAADADAELIASMDRMVADLTAEVEQLRTPWWQRRMS